MNTERRTDRLHHGGTGWVMDMFPGDAEEIPSDAERDRADALIAEWSERWNEQPVTVARVHPDTKAEGFTNTLAGKPTNRAYLRAQLRRWWRRPGALASCPQHGANALGPGGRCTQLH